MATPDYAKHTTKQDKGKAASATKHESSGGGGLLGRLRGLIGGGGGHAEQEAALDPNRQAGIGEQEAALAPKGSKEAKAAATKSAPGELEQVAPGAGDAAGEAGGPAYFSQRDNEAGYGGGDAQCSPTSFAMQLTNVYGGDVEAVKTRARAILRERGRSSDHTQVEDLLIEIIQTTNWEQATADKPGFFWSPRSWAAWAAQEYGGIYYKDPNAQQYVASLFDEVGNSGAETHAHLYTFAQWAPIIAALDEGAEVTTQGGFTSSGHVVSVTSANADGIVINDPYGLYVEGGYYLRNGEAPRSSLGTSGLAVLRRRAALRSDVVPAYEATRAMPNWGEQNSYTWDEVASIKIGLWFSVLRGH